SFASAVADNGIKTYSQGDRPGTAHPGKVKCNKRSRPKLGLIKSLSKQAKSPDSPTEPSSSRAATPWCWLAPSQPQQSKKVRIISRSPSIIAKKRQPWGNFRAAISSAKGVPLK